MNKFYPILWVLLFISTSLFSQTYWERTYSNFEYEEAVDIVDNQNGTYTVLATSLSTSSGNRGPWLYTIDEFGEIIWEALVEFPNDTNAAKKILLFNNEYWVLSAKKVYRVDLQGDVIATIDIPNAFDIIPSADNTSVLLLTVATPEPADVPRVEVITLDLQGNITDTFVLEDNQIADEIIISRSLITTSDGNYLVVASNFANYEDTFYKITPTGTILWKKVYNWGVYGEPVDLFETPSGDFLITGFYVFEDNLYDHAYLLDNNGDLVWQNRFNLSNNANTFSGTATNDGNYVFASTQADTITQIRSATAFKINSSGELVWQQYYDVRGNSSSSLLNSIIETANGDLIMVGNQENFATTIRTNSEGQIISDCNDERIELNTQAQVDAWPGCTVVDALWITGDDITDLSPLRGLVQAEEFVVSNCPNLQNLNGLQDLSIADSTFVIINNPSLIDISALSNLTTATGFFYLSGLTALPSLNGLQSLTTTDIVYLEGNHLLQSFEELQNIQIIKTFQVYTHDNLTEINLPNLQNITTLENLQIIDNSSLTSIIGLENIETIESGAIIAANEVLPDMTWLRSLQSVGDLFVVASNNGITTLNGLEQLTTIDGGFELSNNPMLLEVDALNNLNTVAGNLNFLDNSVIESCCGLYPLFAIGTVGSSSISGNAACNSVPEILFECQPDDCNANVTLTSQAEVNDYIGCETIAEVLTISGEDITDLSPLSSLQEIGAVLSIRNNPNLTSLAGLNNLQSVGFTIVLNDNNLLTDITALSNISTMQGQLNISNNPALSTLEGLNNLELVNDIILSTNESLTDLSALNNVTTLGLSGEGGFLNIIGNNSLTSINSFNQLTYINNLLLISSNASLQTIDGFGSLTDIRYGVVIANNEELKNLDGFEGLTALGFNFNVITNNPQLENIDAFSNILNVPGGLEISDNVSLTDCCGIYPLLNEGTVNILNISNNPSPCSNQAQVLSFCDDGMLDGVDITLDITADRTEYAIYRDIVYTVSVTNEGTADATNVRVSVPKAAGFNGQLVYSGFRNLTNQTIFYQSVVGQFNIPSVPAGETMTFELVLFPLVGDQPIDVFGEIIAQDQADIDSISDFDNDQIPDEDDEALVTLTPVNSNSPFSDLEMYITSDLQFASIGDEVTYTVSVTNKGPFDATDISVSHLGFFGQSYLSHAQNAGLYNADDQLWNIGNLAVGSTVMLQFTLIQNGFPNANQANVVYFQVQTAGQNDKDSAPGNAFENNYGHEDDEVVYSIYELSNEVGNTPDLELDLTVDNTEYSKFSYVTYHLTVTNTGASAATGVKIDWQVPEGLAHHEAIISNGRYYSWSGEWFIDTPIEAGASENIEFTLWTNVEGVPITSYAQVVQMDGPDADSFVGNGTCCVANEDDEAAITIGINNFNAGAILGFQAATTSEAATVQPTQLRKLVVHNVFPNPATDYVMLGVSTTLEKGADFSVYNASGTVVKNGQLLDSDFYQEHRLNIDDLPSGMYIVRFHTGEDHAPVRFMKQKL